MHLIQNVAFFLIFTAFAGIILPSGKFKGYINLCLGLVLILMILKPLTGFLDAGAENLLGGLQTSSPDWGPSAEAYSGIQKKMLAESLNAQAAQQLSGICAGHGFKLESAEAEPSGDYLSIQSLSITVSMGPAQNRPFIYVGPSASEEAAEIKKLRNAISEVYNMSVDNIHITER